MVLTAALFLAFRLFVLAESKGAKLIDILYRDSWFLSNSTVKPSNNSPGFVVARQRQLTCQHIWNRICGIEAILTGLAFVHKSLGAP